MSTITDLSVVDVFDRAERGLGEYGWCQYSFADDAGRMCLKGAVLYAVTGRPRVRRVLAPIDLTSDEQALYVGAARYLVRVVGTERLDRWNDEAGRTQDEVLDVLRAARKLAGGAS